MQPRLFSSTVSFCEGGVAPNSIYAVLHRECRILSPRTMPTPARDQARYVRSGRLLVNRLETYSASQVMASDSVGSVDLVPVLSSFLPASMEA